MSVAAEINDIIELESKTPARKVLAKCKEYERKNEKYLVEIPRVELGLTEPKSVVLPLHYISLIT